MKFPSLNLPPCRLRTRLNPAGWTEVWDSQRKKYVKLTPEEWVRQHFVRYLIDHLGYPAGVIGNEIQIAVGNTDKRCDSVVFSSEGKPLVILEYKAPQVELTQKVFDQIVRYDTALQVPYLVVSNGHQHYCCRLRTEEHRFEFLQAIPRWEEIQP